MLGPIGTILVSAGAGLIAGAGAGAVTGHYSGKSAAEDLLKKGAAAVPPTVLVQQLPQAQPTPQPAPVAAVAAAR